MTTPEREGRTNEEIAQAIVFKQWYGDRMPEMLMPIASIKDITKALDAKDTRISALEAERAIWQSTRDVNVDLCRQIQSLSEANERLICALEIASRQFRHAKDDNRIDGGCIVGCAMCTVQRTLALITPTKKSEAQ